jgi:hypothetical protein
MALLTTTLFIARSSTENLHSLAIVLSLSMQIKPFLLNLGCSDYYTLGTIDLLINCTYRNQWHRTSVLTSERFWFLLPGHQQGNTIPRLITFYYLVSLRSVYNVVSVKKHISLSKSWIRSPDRTAEAGEGIHPYLGETTELLHICWSIRTWPPTTKLIAMVATISPTGHSIVLWDSLRVLSTHRITCLSKVSSMKKKTYQASRSKRKLVCCCSRQPYWQIDWWDIAALSLAKHRLKSSYMCWFVKIRH